MKNVDAYQLEGYQEWLEEYKNNLENTFKLDNYSGLMMVKTLVKKFRKELKTNDLSDDEIVDYARLSFNYENDRSWDFVFTIKDENNEKIIDSDFIINENDNPRETLNALRFMLYLKEKHEKELNNSSINMRK